MSSITQYKITKIGPFTWAWYEEVYNDQSVLRYRTFNKLKDGPVYGFRPNGELAFEGMYKKGLKHGEFITWYSDNDVVDQPPKVKWSRRIPYYKGLKHGTVYRYYKHGPIMETQHFKHGKPHGLYQLSVWSDDPTQNGWTDGHFANTMFKFIDQTTYDDNLPYAWHNC